MKKFWIDCLLATLFVFVSLYGLKQLTSLRIFNAFDVIGQAVSDMELADIAFSSIRTDPPADTNVVVVNIGYLSRGEIGDQIRNIARFNPKVIGLDMIFSCDFYNDSIMCPQAFDTANNERFASAVRAFKNFVMVERVTQTDSLVNLYGDVDIYDSIEHSHPNLLQTAYEGFANLETEAGSQEDLKACRRFPPRIVMADGTEELAFSVKMAMLYDSVKTRRFLDRNKSSEVINYRGNIVDWHGASGYPGRYPVLDWDQALDPEGFAEWMIRDKIVIFGFLGADLTDTSWDDKFFTPLNKKYAGKSRPDMYGVVVHANIVSMVLSEDYIDELLPWQEYVIAFILVFMNVVLFSIITRRMPVWFDSLSLLVQVIQVVILGYLMVQVPAWSNFKLNLTVSMAAVALVGTCFELYGTLVKRVMTFVANRVPVFGQKKGAYQ
jgi:CHASE2 domain-containing sensor protein